MTSAVHSGIQYDPQVFDLRSPRDDASFFDIFAFFNALLTPGAYDGCGASVSIASRASFGGLAVIFTPSGLCCAGRCTGFDVATLAVLGSQPSSLHTATWSRLCTWPCVDPATEHTSLACFWASCTRWSGVVLRIQRIPRLHGSYAALVRIADMCGTA
ncbi:hypothetical protein Trydic_g23046 [Trypoxylus dichotomus]